VETELLSPGSVLVAVYGYGLFRVCWVLTSGIMSSLPTATVLEVEDGQKIPDFLRFLMCVTERCGKDD